jgi:hypothetical protein
VQFKKEVQGVGFNFFVGSLCRYTINGGLHALKSLLEVSSLVQNLDKLVKQPKLFDLVFFFIHERFD